MSNFKTWERGAHANLCSLPCHSGSSDLSQHVWKRLTTTQLWLKEPDLMCWRTGFYCPLLARMTPDASALMVLPEFSLNTPKPECRFHRPSPLPHKTPRSSGQEDATLSPKSSGGASYPLFLTVDLYIKELKMDTCKVNVNCFSRDRSVLSRSPMGGQRLNFQVSHSSEYNRLLEASHRWHSMDVSPPAWSWKLRTQARGWKKW